MVRRAFQAGVLVCLTGAIVLPPNASAATAPYVAITRFPAGIMQRAGGPAENDSFDITNAGPGDASITLVPSANFFIVSPSSLILQAGASRTVTIQPVTQQNGFSGGSIRVFVAGASQPLIVPVRLFVGQQPQGIVTPVPSDNQLIISGLAGIPHPGNVSVSNFGNVTMQGMLVPSASWIVPQNSVVDIPPGLRAQLPFVVDPSQRPDAVAPLGATVGNVSMIYLKGTANSIVIAQSGSVNVSVVDISKVSVVSQEPPALLAGETIKFLPGITDSFGFFTDVFFSNKGSAALSSDLRLFYTALGAPSATSLLANVGRLPSGVAAWFPYAPSSIFNIANQIGTMQVRSAESGKVSISSLRGTVPDGVNRYLTAMPVLSSDAGISAGDRLLFAGVEKGPSVHTDLFLQEAAGFTGSYTIDFYDGSGTPIMPNRSGSLLPFGFLTVGDGVPAGARSVRVTNTSSGAARITGFGTVVDESTFDAWTVVDSSRSAGPTSDLILPVPALAHTPSSTFDAWITNGSSSMAPVSIGTSPIRVRRRAVRQGTSAGATPSSTSIVLAPYETRRVDITHTPLGYVRIGGPAGAISASGRLTSTVPGRRGAFGTGVPALPASRAAGPGIVRRFARVNDIPNVSPPTLLLLEVAGRPATVRVTIGFSFPAGSTVSGHIEVSNEYDIAAGQLLTIPDLVHAIFGAQRDTLGELTNVVVDVEVIAGDGRVLSYLQTVDTSGDLTFSVE